MISHVTYQTPMMTLCRLYFGSWSDAAQLLLTLMIDQQSMDAPSFDGATFSLSHAERQQAANWFASATDNYVRQQEKNLWVTTTVHFCLLVSWRRLTTLTTFHWNNFSPFCVGRSIELFDSKRNWSGWLTFGLVCWSSIAVKTFPPFPTRQQSNNVTWITPIQWKTSSSNEKFNENIFGNFPRRF